MSLLTMPLLIANLGGEMLYILEQRLQAQAINVDKSKRVLQDVISTMFAAEFVEELFKPQEIYTNAATRKIFDRLAHSSIMRLNETSMDKLYDLMTMGFKYQMMAATQPADLFQVSLNHLDVLAEIVLGSDVECLINNFRARFVDRYGLLSRGSWALLRQTLARFFQDRHVKVSLFLLDSIQCADGSFVISHVGSLPQGTQTPGQIRYFSGGRLLVDHTTTAPLPNAANVYPAPFDFSLEMPQRRTCLLGSNMYAKNRKGPDASSRPVSPPIASAASKKSSEKNTSQASKGELNLLARFVVGSAASEDTDNFTLQLFKENDDSDFSDATLTFDSTSTAARTRTLEQHVGLLGFGDSRDEARASSALPAAGAPAGDDLLDLLDAAS